MTNGYTIWFTGLRGAGKSTVARLVERSLRAGDERVELLDDNVLRASLSRELGVSREDRETHVRRVAFVADLLSRNETVVVAAVVSPYRSTRDEVRGLMDGRFVEVYVKASIEECARRDKEGLYEKAFRGDIRSFTGVSAPYEEPLNPELVLDTEHEEPAMSAARVLAFIDSLFGYLRREPPRALPAFRETWASR